MIHTVIENLLLAEISFEQFNLYHYLYTSLGPIKERMSSQYSVFPYHVITLAIIILLYLYCLKEAIPAAFAIAPHYKFKSSHVENNDNASSKIGQSKFWLKIKKTYFRIKTFTLSRKQIGSLLHLTCGLVILIVPFLIYLVDGTRVGEWKSISLCKHNTSANYRRLNPINSLEYTELSTNMIRERTPVSSTLFPVSSDFTKKSFYNQDILLTLQSIDSSFYFLSKDHLKENENNYMKILKEKTHAENTCISVLPLDMDSTLDNEEISPSYHRIEDDQKLYRYHYNYKTPLWLYLTILVLSLMTILSGFHLIFLRLPAHDIASIRGYTVAITSGMSYIALGAVFRLRLYSIYYPIACGMALFSLYAFLYAWSDAFHHTLWFLQRRYLLHRIYPFFSYYHVQKRQKNSELANEERCNSKKENAKDEETKKEKEPRQCNKKLFTKQLQMIEIEKIERRYFEETKLDENETSLRHTFFSILVSSLYKYPSLKGFRYTHAPSNLVTVIPVLCIAVFTCTTLVQIRLLFFSTISDNRLMQWLLQILEKKFFSTGPISLIYSSNVVTGLQDVGRLVYLLPWCCNNGLLATLASTYATLIGSLVLHGKMSQRKGAILSLFMAVLPLLNIIYLSQLTTYNNEQYKVPGPFTNSCIIEENQYKSDEILKYMNANRHGFKDLLNLLFVAFT